MVTSFVPATLMPGIFLVTLCYQKDGPSLPHDTYFHIPFYIFSIHLLLFTVGGEELPTCLT